MLPPRAGGLGRRRFGSPPSADKGSLGGWLLSLDLLLEPFYLFPASAMEGAVFVDDLFGVAGCNDYGAIRTIYRLFRHFTYLLIWPAGRFCLNIGLVFGEPLGARALRRPVYGRKEMRITFLPAGEVRPKKDRPNMWASVSVWVFLFLSAF